MRSALTRYMKRILATFSAALLGITLGSCSSEKPSSAGPLTPLTGPAAPVKTTRNTTYVTPPVQGPVPRNPDINLSSNFPKSGNISFSRVPSAGQYIAMTFDDGPHAQNTPRLLDMLRARNIKATFFVVGRNVDLYPGIARQIVAEGHEIGTHTYTHRLLTKLSDDQVRQEFDKTRDAIVKATGIQPRVMRPPYGALLQRQREWLHAEYGYPTILWSVDPNDWQRPGSAVVCSRILTQTSPGGIILAHDIHAGTIDAMPATLDGLLKKGYKFVTVSQLLSMQSPGASAPATAEPKPLPAP
jgi:peptidoglycan-N-acetylglucosamine deacetylase